MNGALTFSSFTASPSRFHGENTPAVFSIGLLEKRPGPSYFPPEGKASLCGFNLDIHVSGGSASSSQPARYRQSFDRQCRFARRTVSNRPDTSVAEREEASGCDRKLASSGLRFPSP